MYNIYVLQQNYRRNRKKLQNYFLLKYIKIELDS